MKKITLSMLACMFAFSSMNAQIKVSGATGSTPGSTVTGNTLPTSSTIIVGNSNSTVNNSVIIGNQAGMNATGGGNTFVGQGSAEYITSGHANAFLGTWSGSRTTTGTANTILGQYCGFHNTIGNANVFIGQGAADDNISGSLNVFIGHGAGRGNIDGGWNIAIGKYAEIVNPNLHNAITIGSDTRVFNDNNMILGGIDTNAVDIGIGTFHPIAHIHTENEESEHVLFSTTSFDTDAESKLTVRADNSSTGNLPSDVRLMTYGITNANNLLPAGIAPAIPYNQISSLTTDGGLAIGMDNYERPGSIHFINYVNNGASTQAQECMRVNERNGFVGVHSRTANTAGGTGEPQALFHVNLTNPVMGDLNTAVNGIRFEGLPQIDHPEVIVIDRDGNLARADYNSPTSNAWQLFGNNTTTTPGAWIGTTTGTNDDFRIRTNGIQRARFTYEGNFDLGGNFLQPTTGTITSGAIGTSNTMNTSISSFATGNDNQIDNSQNSAAFGYDNYMSGSSSSMAVGNLNSVNNAINSVAVGDNNQMQTNVLASTTSGTLNMLDDVTNSIAVGNENNISTSNNAAVFGDINTISSSSHVMAAGRGNNILSSTDLGAIGANNLVDGSEESFIGGESNEMFNGHGTFVGGGHNYSDGKYNVVLGDYLIADATSSVTVPSAPGITDENIMIIGERLNSNLKRSLSTGFNGNRTTVTTEDGLAVQLNPLSGNTYVPTVNFEVQAGVTTTTPQPLGPVRSNIRFHNLPQATQPLPAVVIDPTTGELFRTVSSSYAKPGKGGSDEGIDQLKEENDALKERVSLLESQLSLYDEKFAQLERSLNQICESGCGGLNLQGSDILYQSIPNPGSNKVMINYYLANDYRDASISLYSVDGKQIGTYMLTPGKGDGTIDVNISELVPGMYLYRLVVDGKQSAVKKLQKQ